MTGPRKTLVVATGHHKFAENMAARRAFSDSLEALLCSLEGAGAFSSEDRHVLTLGEKGADRWAREVAMRHLWSGASYCPDGARVTFDGEMRFVHQGKWSFASRLEKAAMGARVALQQGYDVHVLLCWDGDGPEELMGLGSLGASCQLVRPTSVMDACPVCRGTSSSRWFPMRRGDRTAILCSKKCLKAWTEEVTRGALRRVEEGGAG